MKRSAALSGTNLLLFSSHMRRFILTGAPGSGKTAILRQLQLDGFSVVEEAATDVIATSHSQGLDEPWRNPSFIDDIANLQKQRQISSSCERAAVQFHDRSAVCTAALATYLGHPASPLLTSELERIKREDVFEKRVFFVCNLGFVEPTAARRITFEETIHFEKIHEHTYRQFGFELFPIERGELLDRVRIIKSAIL